MNTFLSFLAQEIVKKHGEHLENILIVLPNKRGGLFLRNEFSKIIKSTTWLPEVTDTVNFAENLSEITILDNLTLLLELFDVYQTVTKNKKEDITLHQFISIGQTLLQDFNEIDRYMLNTNDFFKTINDVYAMEHWEVEKEEIADSKIGSFIQFWKELNPLYEAFNERLKKQEAGYQGMAFRTAANCVKEQQFNEKATQYEKIYFAGFNAINKAEEIIIKGLIKQKKAEIFWDADNYYLGDFNQEAGMFLRPFKKDEILGSGFHNFNSLSETQKSIEIYDASGNVAQVKWAANLVEEIADKNPNLNQTAIVLADEDLLLPLLQSLPQNIDGVNITMGLTLKQSSIFNFFRLFVKLHYNAQKMQQGGFYHKDIELLLNSNISKIIFKRIEIDAFKKALNEQNITFFVPKNTNISISKEIKDSLFSSVSESEEIVERFQKIIEKIKTVLLAEENKDAFLLEQLYNSQLLANRLAALQQKYNCFSSIESLNFFIESLANSHKIDFVGEPLIGLQILGMLETRNLDFKNVILLGANEGILPQEKSGSSFITNDVKHFFKLPDTKKKDAVFAYHFYHLLQRAENIYIAFNNQAEGLKSGEESRFVTQLQYEFNQKNKVSPTIKSYDLTIKTSQENDQKLEIIKTKEVISQIDVFFDKKSISPSSLNAFFACPLDFYFRKIIGIREKDEVDEVVDARLLGQIVHEVLQKIYEPYVGRIIDLQKISEITDETISSLTSIAFANNFKNNQQLTGKNYLTFEIIKQLIKGFLKKDLKRLKKQGTTSIVRLEEPLTAGKSFSINGKAVNLKFNGIIDRIEKQGNHILILDYKTGSLDDKITLNGKEFNLPKHKQTIQLLFYYFLLSENSEKLNIDCSHSNAAIYDLQHLSKELQFLKTEALATDELHLFNEIIENDFLEVIYDSAIPFTHSEEAKYCKLCK